jgi:hypothetical protein
MQLGINTKTTFFKILFYGLVFFIPVLTRSQSLQLFTADSTGGCSIQRASDCWKDTSGGYKLLNNPSAKRQKEYYYVSQIKPSSGAKIYFHGYVPENYTTDANKRFPLIIYLHGNESITKGNINCLCFTRSAPFPASINEGPAPVVESPVISERTGLYPSFYKNQFVVVSPNRPTDYYPQGFNPVFVNEIIDMARFNFRIDTNRIYLMGISKGGGDALGYASYSHAYAERVAAIVTFSANGGNPSPLCQTIADNQVAVWAFQINSPGEDQSEKILSAINACESPTVAKLTIRQVNASSQLYRCSIYLRYDNGVVGCHSIPEHKEIIRGATIEDENTNIYDWLMAHTRYTPITGLPTRTQMAVSTLWPNPASKSFKIDIALQEEATVRIVHTGGRQWKEIKGYRGEEIDIDQIPEGVYIVNVITDQFIDRTKLSIIK